MFGFFLCDVMASVRSRREDMSLGSDEMDHFLGLVSPLKHRGGLIHLKCYGQTGHLPSSYVMGNGMAYAYTI